MFFKLMERRNLDLSKRKKKKWAQGRAGNLIGQIRGICYGHKLCFVGFFQWCKGYIESSDL